jgi:hypothetical protein
MRKPFPPYIDMLHRWQRRLRRVEAVDADPFDRPVDLADVVAAARALDLEGDSNWH